MLSCTALLHYLFAILDVYTFGYWLLAVSYTLAGKVVAGSIGIDRLAADGMYASSVTDDSHTYWLREGGLTILDCNGIAQDTGRGKSGSSNQHG